MKKRGIKNLNPTDSYVFTNIVFISLFIIYLSYLLSSKRCNLAFLKDIKNDELIFTILSSIITLISSIIFINLIKMVNVSELIPTIQPVVILLNLLIAYFLFNETITLNQVIGCISIIFGLFLINNK